SRERATRKTRCAISTVRNAPRGTKRRLQLRRLNGNSICSRFACPGLHALPLIDLNSEVDLGTWVFWVRQSPDWRFAGRHSGEWRSRVRPPALINQTRRNGISSKHHARTPSTIL